MKKTIIILVWLLTISVSLANDKPRTKRDFIKKIRQQETRIKELEAVVKSQQVEIAALKKLIKETSADTKPPKTEQSAPSSISSSSQTKSNQTESRAINISYEQVMEYLSDFLIMEKSTPVRGQDRYTGQTADSLAVLEIIGNKNNISEATILIGIPNDAPDKLVRNTILAMRFLKNTVPEWANSAEWITANAKRVADIPGASDVKVVKGDKLITMTFLKPLGMLTLTVKHK